jgi:hypothetical protein
MDKLMKKVTDTIADDEDGLCKKQECRQRVFAYVAYPGFTVGLCDKHLLSMLLDRVKSGQVNPDPRPTPAEPGEFLLP